MSEALPILLEIDVPIYFGDGGAYICFMSDLDVCNDGTGEGHGDKHFQPMTAYRKGGYLSAERDCYLVTPPQIIAAVPGIVLGCLGRLTNTLTGAQHAGVWGEVGPPDKTGEAAYCLAKKVNSGVTHNSGDKRKIYLYEMWPDIPAVVNNKEYELQPS